MLKKIELPFLIIAIAFFAVAISGITGTLQQVVHFTDVLNEIAVVGMSLFGGVIFSLGVKK